MPEPLHWMPGMQRAILVIAGNGLVVKWQLSRPRETSQSIILAIRRRLPFRPAVVARTLYGSATVIVAMQLRSS
jgi:hypothetical protein